MSDMPSYSVAYHTSSHTLDCSAHIKQRTTQNPESNMSAKSFGQYKCQVDLRKYNGALNVGNYFMILIRLL